MTAHHIDDRSPVHPAIDQPSDTDSRRRFVRTALGAAAGAIGVATITHSAPANATTGAMQYGAVNAANGDLTTLTSTRANNATYHVVNTGSNGIAYSGSATNIGINVVGGNLGAQFRADNASGTGVSARADAPNGTGGSFAGINGYGVSAYGEIAAVLLQRTQHPPFVGTHKAGELFAEADGIDRTRVWVCIQDGTPGIWRALASAESAGSFHAISPHRVYDSRWADGPVPTGGKRVISTRDGRSLNGVVDKVDLVPAGATTIAYNLTVTDTTGSGFVAITPGDATGYRASAVNWSAAGTTIANASVVPVDAQRNVAVFTGGGSTHVILDVVGYYR